MAGVLGRACAVAVLAVAGFVSSEGVAIAAADPPSVVVTPTDVTDGDTVGLDISGFPYGVGGTVECSANATSVPADQSINWCRIVGIHFPVPAHAEMDVRSLFDTSNGHVDCHIAPGCVVGLFSPGSPSVAAFAPVTFGPDLAPTPLPVLRNRTDGDTVSLLGGGTPPSDAAVAQCDKAFLDDPTPARAAALCSPSTPVVDPPEDGFTADLVVHDPLVTTNGDTWSCGYDTCVIVLSSGAAPRIHDVGVSFGPPLVSVSPTEHLRDRHWVNLWLAGSPSNSVSASQCLLPLGPTLQTSQCAPAVGFAPVDKWGNANAGLEATITVASTNDCLTASCGFAVSDPTGAWIGQPAPVTFSHIGFGPTDQPFLDGQPISVLGQGLVPGSDYLVQHCAAWAECDAGVTVTADADGRVETSIPAVQRFTTTEGTHVRCRDGYYGSCEVTIADQEQRQRADAKYAMAAGSLSVTPDSGLSDGQAVQVTGTDLMASYDGPTLWVFPTGIWALTQCDQAILGEQNLYGVFVHCSVAPPSHLVHIPGSTLDTTFPVDATIDKILGGTTDCTTGPSACVVGLVRLEQDGSLTTHLAGVTFG